MKSFSVANIFFKFLLRARSRHRIILLATTALAISVISLVVIQGVMSGLQKSLVDRSKNLWGNYHLKLFNEYQEENLNELLEFLEAEEIPFSLGVKLELMLRNKNRVSAAQLVSFDTRYELPKALKEKDFQGLVLGASLATQLEAYYQSNLQIFSPFYQVNIMGEFSRFITSPVSDFIVTNVGQVDAVTAFIDWSRLVNLTRSTKYNRVSFFKDLTEHEITTIRNFFKEDAVLTSWEKENESLSFALKLETFMMNFLFMSMTALISVSIIIGFLVFFNKLKWDMAGLWVLGLSMNNLKTGIGSFILVLSLCICFVSLIIGNGLLVLLEVVDPKLFPSYFVDQNIPIQRSIIGSSIAFIVPLALTLIFGKLALHTFFKGRKDWLQIIRKVG